MQTPITTFIFDCFGVLCDAPISRWYSAKSKEHGFIDTNLLPMLMQFDLDILSEDDIIEHFQTYQGINSSKEYIRQEIDAYLKIDSALVEILKKLKQKGYKVALLSNANNSFFEKKVFLLHPEFKNLFDEMIISSVVGMVKPNPDIYHHTLLKLNSKPEESVFIDDNKTNVDAAVKIGIEGFLYTDRNAFEQYLKEKGVEI